MCQGLTKRRDVIIREMIIKDVQCGAGEGNISIQIFKRGMQQSPRASRRVGEDCHLSRGHYEKRGRGLGGVDYKPSQSSKLNLGGLYL